MDVRIPNTDVEYEFEDGTKTILNMSFYKLYILKAKNPTLYEKYRKVSMNQENNDELDNVFLLYIAYYCAHLSEENIMTEEEFIIKLGTDRASMIEAFNKLYSPKKGQGLETGSEQKPNQENQV